MDRSHFLVFRPRPRKREAPGNRGGPVALAGLSLVVALLAAACASSGTTTTGAAPTTRPAAPATSAPSGGKAASATSAPSGAAAGGATVTMTDQLKFEPATLTISKGTKVTWRNTGQVAHTVTDDPSKAADKSHAALPSGAQPWDSGMINAGQEYSRTFDVPGTYKYFCIPHEAAGMVGTIIVQ